jgi:Flp pilus assembly protein TadB
VSGAVVIALLCILGAVAMPALLAWGEDRRNRRASEFANGLQLFAREVRSRQVSLPLPADLESKGGALGFPEYTSFVVALTLPRLAPEDLAAATERFATRVRRRITFERKMRARTLSGRRRAAIAGALPVVLALAFAGVLHGEEGDLPFLSIAVVAMLECAGAALLWRFATVEI